MKEVLPLDEHTWLNTGFLPFADFTQLASIHFDNKVIRIELIIYSFTFKLTELSINAMLTIFYSFSSLYHTIEGCASFILRVYQLKSSLTPLCINIKPYINEAPVINIQGKYIAPKNRGSSEYVFTINIDKIGNAGTIINNKIKPIIKYLMFFIMFLFN